MSRDQVYSRGAVKGYRIGPGAFVALCTDHGQVGAAETKSGVLEAIVGHLGSDHHSTVTRVWAGVE